MVLPQIPSAVVKKIDDLIREYLWGGKKAKIAYSILQNPKKEGGLNLVNLVKKDKSLKATWPRILSMESEYASLVYKNMRISGLDSDIWRCNLEAKDIKSLKLQDTFWEDVLLSWSEYNSYRNKRVENQLIWYNSQIRVENKIIWWKDVHNKGLKYVHQLFCERKFISIEEAKECYGLSVMRLNSLKKALPEEWRSFFQEEEKSIFFPLPPHNYDQIQVTTGKSFSKEVYDVMADDRLLIHNKYIKWRMEIGDEISETLTDFTSLFRDIYRVTNIAKLRSFQYRLLQRALVTNVQLQQWGIKESDMCTFCETHRETVPHLMYMCEKVHRLWKDVENMLKAKDTDIEIDINVGTVMKNQIVGRKGHVGNLICLMLKQYVYRQKCMEGDLSFIQFKQILFQTEQIEKYIAVKNGKLSKHMGKWEKKGEINNYIQEYVMNL